jgi:hypothetical protein
MKKLMELLGKKGKSLDENSIKAKMEVLKDLKSQAMDAMGSKLNGAKKVEVAADSTEGLKSGLDKAKELLGKDLSPQDETELGEENEEDEDESPEEEASESDEVESLEDIEAKIHELLAKKQSLIGKK